MFHSSRIRAYGSTTTGEGWDGGKQTPESRGDGAQRRVVRIYEPRFAITPNFPKPRLTLPGVQWNLDGWTYSAMARELI